MSNTREDSPDWLRSFQVPNLAVTTLSSDSEPSGESPIKYERDGEEDEGASDTVIQSDANKSSSKKTEKKRMKAGNELPAKRRKTEKLKNSGSEDDGDVKKEECFEEKTETPAASNQLIWALSSDSESNAEVSARKEEVKEESSSHQSLELLNKEEKDDNAVTTPKVAVKRKSPKKRLKTESDKATEKKTNYNVKVEGEGGDMDVPEEGIPEKHVEHRVTSSRMPLILPEKVQRFKALVECEGESIDLSGDMGAVGRVMIAENPSKEPEMFLDLKGTIYKTTIVPSRTFCVVSIGQSEAKIEAIMNDFIQLAPQSNVYDAETMVEGTLDGFSFDSEDEADKTTKDTKGDQAEGGEEKTNAKTKGKADKKLGGTQKKGKATGGKQPKKRKPQAAKKGKAKK